VQLLTVEMAVDRTLAQITPAFYDFIGVPADEFRAGREAAFAAEDKNGDDLVCVILKWGDELNDNAHWSEIYADYLADPSATEAFLIRDNNTGR
jgi:hypothetical protein